MGTAAVGGTRRERHCLWQWLRGLSVNRLRAPEMEAIGIDARAAVEKRVRLC